MESRLTILYDRILCCFAQACMINALKQRYKVTVRQLKQEIPRIGHLINHEQWL